jgi:hypothetical protein
VVGAPGEPGFDNGCHDLSTPGKESPAPVAFSKDATGHVHLKSAAAWGGTNALSARHSCVLGCTAFVSETVTKTHARALARNVIALAGGFSLHSELPAERLTPSEAPF